MELLGSCAVENEAIVEDNDVLYSMRGFFDAPDKDDIFNVQYSTSDAAVSRSSNPLSRVEVNFTVKGVRRDLGQTLDSTGLTM